MNFNEQARQYENMMLRRESWRIEEMEDEREEEGLAEAEPDYEAIMERKAISQMEYFKRGGR